MSDIVDSFIYNLDNIDTNVDTNVDMIGMIGMEEVAQPVQPVQLVQPVQPAQPVQPVQPVQQLIPIPRPIPRPIPQPVAQPVTQPLYVLNFDPAPINMSYCLVNAELLKIAAWGLFSVKDSTNEGTARKLKTNLDQLNLTKGIRCIVTHEHQPRCNIKTITICGHIQMYYVLKDFPDGDIIEKVVGTLASSKLKYYQPMPGDEPMPTERLDKLTKGHYRNKQIAIEHCRRVLKQNNEDQRWIDMMNKKSKSKDDIYAGKLDDLSDSYLLALSYIKNNKLGKFRV